MRRRISIFISLPLAWCFSLGSVASGEPTSPLRAVHEWGTFTSVVGSDGALLSGCQHEEAPLPAFVHRLENQGAEEDDLDTLPSGPMTRSMPMPRDEFPEAAATVSVTQKLETPVLYFYQNEDTDQLSVQVDVDFPLGTLSQWFPYASQINEGGGRLRGGFATWRATLSKTDSRSLPATLPTSIWNPSREVQSDRVLVRSESGEEPIDEVEKLIFYRGLGDFAGPFETMIKDGQLVVKNPSANEGEDIPRILVLRYDPDTRSGIVHDMGSLGIGASSSVPLSELSKHILPYNDYLATVRSDLKKALTAEGLYADEAEAMINTWQKSYFLTSGLRVLYIVPRPSTDRILPLRLNPAPSELVRVLVGRVEVLTPADEAELVEVVRNAHPTIFSQRLSASRHFVSGIGPFAEPKLRRVIDLLGTDMGSFSLSENIRRFIRKMNGVETDAN